MTAPTFDPQSTNVTFGPITLQGAMDGEYFNAKFQEAKYELHVGSQGFTTFVKNANESGMVKYTLSQESPSNRELSLAYAAGLKAMLQMEDLNNGTLVEGPDTVISEHAEIKRGNKVVGHEWTFLVARMAIAAGGDQ